MSFIDWLNLCKHWEIFYSAHIYDQILLLNMFGYLSHTFPCSQTCIFSLVIILFLSMDVTILADDDIIATNLNNVTIYLVCLVLFTYCNITFLNNSQDHAFHAPLLCNITLSQEI